jgi:hypothetical protein
MGSSIGAVEAGLLSSDDAIAQIHTKLSAFAKTAPPV